MSLIKQHLHQQNSQVELNLLFKDVEYIISYLEETDDIKSNIIADQLREQLYA